MGWRFVARLVLIAFTLQSYVTQSHVHDKWQGQGISSISKSDSKAPPHRKSPLDDSPLSCPICQAISHASVYLTAAALPLLPALCAELAAPIFTTNPVIAAFWHDWRSRAPPRR